MSDPHNASVLLDALVNTSTEVVLRPSALDHARVIDEFGSVIVRFAVPTAGGASTYTDLVFVATAGNVADELRRLADRIHTPAASNLSVVVDRAAEVAELTESQAQALTHLVENVLAEYVWCSRCDKLVPKAIAQAHATRKHPRGAIFSPARFLRSGGDDE